MVILLFGISNVGKSTTGEGLAEKLNYSFLDMDEEIKKKFQTTLEKFMKDYSWRRCIILCVPFVMGGFVIDGRNFLENY